MKRPWHYWVVFVGAVLVVLGAMAWLTVKAVELDRAETLTRLQADQDEDIGRALWRMDVKLMPHLAREAAQPHTVYQPVLNTVSADGMTNSSLVSPLLTNRSEYVLVNFEVEPGDVWSSPQTPVGPVCDFVCSNGASMVQISDWTVRLGELKEQVSYDRLSGSLPSVPLPQVDGSNTINPTTYVQNYGVDVQQIQQMQQAANVANASPGQRSNSRMSQQERVANSFLNRNSALQSIASQQQSSQALHFNQIPTPAREKVLEGVSQPMWVGSELLLARRVERDDRVVIQGCWMDWNRIRAALKSEVADLFPKFELQPVIDASRTDVSRMLATLPVQIVVPEVEVVTAPWSAIRVSLAAAWACMLIAAVAAGILLHGVLSLSERRASFVSAVTHELRTPLTTFRMYSEMLAQNMVPDEAKRRRYLETLRVEADRLSHLVENVLSYARLERGRQGKRRVKLTVADLLAPMEERFQDRTRQAEMKLEVELPDGLAERAISTDAAAVEQILFNLVDNACKYASASQDRRVHVEVAATKTQIEFRVRDHGAGISSHEAKRLFQPFSKSADQAANSAPGVGLGLALCRRLAKELDGRLELDAGAERGATFRLILPVS